MRIGIEYPAAGLWDGTRAFAASGEGAFTRERGGMTQCGSQLPIVAIAPNVLEVCNAAANVTAPACLDAACSIVIRLQC